MAESGYICDDRNWTTPKPDCTCGAGNDAPTSAHYSRRFGGRPDDPTDRGPTTAGATEGMWNLGTLMQVYEASGIVGKSDCALYTWNKGCHGSTWEGKPNKVSARACPHNGCNKRPVSYDDRALFCVCENHGGDAEAVRRMTKHMLKHHTKGA